ncbi:MAG: lectin [Chloroflexota bacterium]|nr:lectin [Chloroflexota bacterium]
MSDKMLPGQELLRGERLVSHNGKYSLVMQDDGNLVLYDGNGTALWNSGTQNIAIQKCVMQPDGNLILYRYDGVAAWSSGTNGKPGANLIIQNDGNVVIYYEPKPEAIWATGTNHQTSTTVMPSPVVTE